MDDPFSELESDNDPIMVAARLSKMTIQQHEATQSKLDEWRHASGTLPAEPTSPIRPTSRQPLGIMVLGKTGDGKSSLLNDILGRQVFVQKASLRSQTKTIEEREGFWAPLRPYLHGKDTFGCHVCVYDTPGFGDSDHQDELFIPLIQDRIQALSQHVPPKLHCFLMVFKITST
ncbi:hypothetical protein DM01DRAFT_116803 [Hesseltinella vesiculosa]|uniref:AIG1-type G domain-containing protein n=1 Tax=Hesseltinella vesiculosa TaxID=101127 RepID=A0A1X2GKB4_9FUNG|nr:hypothetical protein DM01DRAFT_116803 [Hesseltinella vesiculosa]